MNCLLVSPPLRRRVVAEVRYKYYFYAYVVYLGCIYELTLSQRFRIARDVEEQTMSQRLQAHQMTEPNGSEPCRPSL